MTSRNRKFKLRVYPFFAFIFFPLFMIFKEGVPSAAPWQALPQTRFHVLLIYANPHIIIGMIPLLCYSDQPQVAWIYHGLAIEKPGHILSGTIKAVITRIFLPIFMLFALFILFHYYQKTDWEDRSRAKSGNLLDRQA